MDEKRFYISIIIIFIMASLIGIIFLSVTFTGLMIGNTTVETENDPFIWYEVPNQSWSQDTSKTITLSDYTSDPENYSLVYTNTFVRNITFTFSNGILTMTPDSGFYGNRTVIFTGNDYVNSADSNVVYLNVTYVVPTVPTTTTSPGGGGSSGSGGGTEGRAISPITYVPSAEYKNKDIYLKDYLENGRALIDFADAGYRIYFDDESFIFINKIVDNENLIIVEFQNNLGVINSMTLTMNETNFFDINSDNINEYTTMLQGFKNGKPQLFFETVGMNSFILKGVSFVDKYWWLIGIFIIIFLIAMIYFLLV